MFVTIVQLERTAKSAMFRPNVPTEFASQGNSSSSTGTSVIE
jgi:hypothetical protein